MISKIQRQAAPNSVVGRTSMYEIQATVAMKQSQIRLDTTETVAPAAGICLGARNSAIYTHLDLIPEPHTRTSKRIWKDRQRRTLHIKYLTRSSYKNFLRTPPKNCHTSMNAEHLQDLSARKCKDLLRMNPTGFPQDLLTRTCTRSRKDLLEDLSRIPTRAPHQELERI